jgi:hypothetical protein
MHIILPKSDRIKAVNCSINSNLYLFNAVNNNVADAGHTLDVSYDGSFPDTFTNSSGNKQVNVIVEIPPRISLGAPNGVSSGDDLYVVLTASCPKDQNDKVMNLYAGIRNPSVSNYAAFAHSDANSADYDSWFCILKAKAEAFTISIAVDSGSAFTNVVSLSSLGIYSEESWNRMQQAALLQMYQRHVYDAIEPEVRYVDSSLKREITHVADPTRSDSAVNKKYLDDTFVPLTSTVPYGYELLCTYFLSTSERLHYALSSDGMNFGAPNILKPWGNESVRDPSCAYINGQTYFTWTRPTDADGGAFGTTNTIAIAKLSDLGEAWRSVITPTIPNQTIIRLWAPDFYQEGNTLYIIFNVRTIETDFMPYEVHADHDYDNADSYSAARPLGIQPYGGIDHHICKDANGLYHDLSADNSIIMHRTCDKLVGNWSAPQQVDTSWRMMEAPASFQMANGNWRVFFDGGGLPAVDQNDGNITNNDGLMMYSDFSNDFSSHTPLKSIPTAMRHCGLALIPSNYIKGETRITVGSTIGGAILTNTKDISYQTSPSKKFLCEFDKIDTFGAVKNTGFGGPNNATQGITVEDGGLYIVSANLYINGVPSGSFLTANILCYPDRDYVHPILLGPQNGTPSTVHPANNAIHLIALTPITVLLRPRDQIVVAFTCSSDATVSESAYNCYLNITKVA